MMYVELCRIGDSERVVIADGNNDSRGGGGCGGACVKGGWGSVGGISVGGGWGSVGGWLSGGLGSMRGGVSRARSSGALLFARASRRRASGALSSRRKIGP